MLYTDKSACLYKPTLWRKCWTERVKKINPDLHRDFVPKTLLQLACYHNSIYSQISHLQYSRTNTVVNFIWVLISLMRHGGNQYHDLLLTQPRAITLARARARARADTLHSVRFLKRKTLEIKSEIIISCLQNWSTFAKKIILFTS